MTHGAENDGGEKVLYVRMPADVHEALKRWAQEERRPLGNLALIVLERALQERSARRVASRAEESTEGNQNAEIVELIAA